MRELNTFFDKEHAFINVFCKNNNESMTIRGRVSNESVKRAFQTAEEKGMIVTGGSINGHTHLKQVVGQKPEKVYKWAVEATQKDEWLPELYLLALVDAPKNDMYFCKAKNTGMLQVYIEEPWSFYQSVYRITGMDAVKVVGHADAPQKIQLPRKVIENVIDVLQNGKEMQFFDKLSAKKTE